MATIHSDTAHYIVVTRNFQVVREPPHRHPPPAPPPSSPVNLPEGGKYFYLMRCYIETLYVADVHTD